LVKNSGIKKILEDILDKAEIPQSSRPEQLEVDKYVLLSNLLFENGIDLKD
jgi:16S rRNA A1518/A1519 N6-dimethyltransferase RsmA/KsgA/DIM1 with predicted DNA glycosylase/AP lyase activity